MYNTWASRIIVYRSTIKMWKLNVGRLKVLSRCLINAQYSTCGIKPIITVSKTAPLIDEKVQIIVSGLIKHQRITLHGSLKDSDKIFASWGHYIANEEGKVDTFHHSSHGGTFEGVEPMGLFWSMRSENPERPRRIMKDNVMTPFEVRLVVCDGFVNFESIPWSEDLPQPCLCEYHLQRHLTVPGVQRIPIEENGLYGTLFLPPGEGPFPAVIDIFGLTGGILEIRSPLLASHGIASFTLGYVNYKDLPKNEKELDYNYFLKAFDWLAGHPAIDENAMGGISSCVGGGYLGVIAVKRPSFKCFISLNNTYFPMGTTQVIEGEQIISEAFIFEKVKKTPQGVAFKDMLQEVDEAVFPALWRHGMKMLQIHCLDDQTVNPIFGKKFQQTIPSDFKQNFTHIEYPGAGHLLEPPYMPLCKSSKNLIFRQYLLWGGAPKAHADAQEDSWPKILKFLHTHLQGRKNNSVIEQSSAV